MSPAQRLLDIYSEYQALSDDAPAKIERKERFEEEVRVSSQNGDFNDQLAPENIQSFVHYQWLQSQRKTPN